MGASHAADVICPYCHQQVTLAVDPQTEGTWVEDCEVCCRPWSVVVRRGEDGEIAWISVDRAQ